MFHPVTPLQATVLMESVFIMEQFIFALLLYTLKSNAFNIVIITGGKRDFEGNVANHLDIAASAKKEMRFRRTSSYGDGDVSEASFIDMLKSNAKKNATAEVHGTAGPESSDGTQGGRGGKKKGKKGRQIDPALLGFKVTSNRIMMGEIQRIDD